MVIGYARNNKTIYIIIYLKIVFFDKNEEKNIEKIKIYVGRKIYVLTRMNHP